MDNNRPTWNSIDVEILELLFGRRELTNAPNDLPCNSCHKPVSHHGFYTEDRGVTCPDGSRWGVADIPRLKLELSATSISIEKLKLNNDNIPSLAEQALGENRKE